MVEDPGTPPPWSRRALVAGMGLALAGAQALAASHEGHEAGPGLTPDEALKRLMAGNARYAAGRQVHPDGDVARRRSLTGGQHPFATILACADSRVGPELIFDEGLGDLFVVRVAGNVVDDVVRGSIEYAAIHLSTPLVMVLGHEHCGAVTATVEALSGKSNPADQGSRIGALADLIAPAVKATPADAPDNVEAAVLLNAQRMARRLLVESPPLSQRVRAGRLKIVSARYGLATGAVDHVQTATT